MKPHREDLDKFIDETRASQRNIVFPDTVRNGRAFDAFLWNGSANPTWVQRIGAWMLGIVFMASGLFFLSQAGRARDEDGAWIGAFLVVTVSSLFILGGARVFRNGFPHKPKAKS